MRNAQPSSEVTIVFKSEHEDEVGALHNLHINSGAGRGEVSEKCRVKIFRIPPQSHLFTAEHHHHQRHTEERTRLLAFHNSSSVFGTISHSSLLRAAIFLYYFLSLIIDGWGRSFFITIFHRRSATSSKLRVFSLTIFLIFSSYA